LWYNLIMKPEKKKLDKECLDIWRQAALLLAGNECEYPYCFKTDHLNVHHIFSRSRQSVRYDLSNAIVLCAGHHTLNNDSAHKSPEFLKVILGEIPGYPAIRTETWYQTLRLRAYTPAKLDLKMELLYLQEKLKEIKESKGKIVQ
jgi:hypothetical protein